jgi:hypothetical protein
MNSCYDNMLLALLVLCSSVNYWRHPTLGVRRNADMLCASGSLAYQVFFTSQRAPANARLAYLATVAAGCACYVCARCIRRKHSGALNSTSALHVGLHLFGNLGNLLLYDALGANTLGLR